MFTGIVQEIGIIKKIIKDSSRVFVNVACSKVLENTKLGDSIAVNGVCLTVCELGNENFTADIMLETFKKTNFDDFKTGHKVNLETALTLSSRLGGHIVSGHIDGIGKIATITNEGNAKWFKVNADKNILKYIVEKGSVTLDGMSLTVVDVTNEYFTVSTIPHTTSVTTIGEKCVGENFNIEVDILGKYIEKLLYNSQVNSNITLESKKESITMDFLTKNGFL